jgi:tetratricopeptide (TPR) repeat protein
MAIKKRSEVPATVNEKAKFHVARSEADGRTGEPDAAEVQLNSLAQGVRLFTEGRFGEAKSWFDRASHGPNLAVSHTARTRGEICARRTERPTLNLYSSDDHYHYGVERLNARDLDTARKHLEIALSLKPDVEYALYGLAAALALAGDQTGAYENLKRAIELDPRNRTNARRDSDFAGVVHHPLFTTLLFPERKQPV